MIRPAGDDAEFHGSLNQSTVVGELHRASVDLGPDVGELGGTEPVANLNASVVLVSFLCNLCSKESPKVFLCVLLTLQRVDGYADKMALSETISPSTRRKRQAVADLLAFMAGFGVRINEARSLRLDEVDLDSGAVDINGTKSKAAKRRLTMPDWLIARFKIRAGTTGTDGLVFSSPHHLKEPERRWDASNSAKAVARVCPFSASGFGWATPHTLRRTVATLLDQAGVPIARIADQLGHSDPAMTASVYLGRDPRGDKSSVAEHL